MPVQNRYIMKKKWTCFAYKQFDMRTPRLPFTKTPKNYTAAITLLRYSDTVTAPLGFHPKLFISHCSMCDCYNLAGRFHGWPFGLSHGCGL